MATTSDLDDTTADPQAACDAFVDLIRQAKNGCRHATGELTERYRNYLLLIANQEFDTTLQGKLSASDLVQDTLLLAQCGMPQFRGTTADEWAGWLRQILIRAMQQRGRSYRATASRDVSREVTIHGDRRFNQPPIDVCGGGDSPSRCVSGAEESERLMSAMRSLPRDYQTVVRLRSFQQLSFREVGRRMQRSDDATRKLWNRAIVRLQQAFDDPRNGDPC